MSRYHVVDSCGWLAYYADEVNADHFEPLLRDQKRLIVPSICVYEVCRRVRVIRGEADVEIALNGFSKAKIVDLPPKELANAAKAAHTHKLAMADAIIWQTAQAHDAKLYTQDVDLAHLPDVVYFEK